MTSLVFTSLALFFYSTWDFSHDTQPLPIFLPSGYVQKVRYEDQQKINEFGRLNNRLVELRDDKSHLKVCVQTDTAPPSGLDRHLHRTPRCYLPIRDRPTFTPKGSNVVSGGQGYMGSDNTRFLSLFSSPLTLTTPPPSGSSPMHYQTVTGFLLSICFISALHAFHKGLTGMHAPVSIGPLHARVGDVSSATTSAMPANRPSRILDLICRKSNRPPSGRRTIPKRNERALVPLFLETQDVLDKLDDATTELMTGEGDTVMLMLGDSFMECEEDFATEYCERQQEVCTVGSAPLLPRPAREAPPAPKSRR